MLMLRLPAVLTHSQALETERELRAQVFSAPESVVVDASALTQFDSSALAVLLSCRRTATAAHKSFAIRGLPLKLRQLANLYGVAELIPALI